MSYNITNYHALIVFSSVVPHPIVHQGGRPSYIIQDNPGSLHQNLQIPTQMDIEYVS